MLEVISCIKSANFTSENNVMNTEEEKAEDFNNDLTQILSLLNSRLEIELNNDSEFILYQCALKPLDNFEMTFSL